jgi:hypothetical protein
MKSIRKSRFYAYIAERWQSSKPNVLGCTNQGLLDRSKHATLKIRMAFAAVDKDTGLAEVGLAAVVEVFVEAAQLIQIVCSLGSFGIR